MRRHVLILPDRAQIFKFLVLGLIELLSARLSLQYKSLKININFFPRKLLCFVVVPRFAALDKLTDCEIKLEKKYFRKIKLL